VRCFRFASANRSANWLASVVRRWICRRLSNVTYRQTCGPPNIPARSKAAPMVNIRQNL
jgi:hypothetical protein